MKGTWKGSSLSGDPEGYVEEGSGDGHLSIGAVLGNLEGVSFTGNFRRWMRRVFISVGAPLWDLGSRVRLPGTLINH